jgi:hypothetical protein
MSLCRCIGVQFDAEDGARDILAEMPAVDRAVQDRGDLAVKDAPLSEQLSQSREFFY